MKGNKSNISNGVKVSIIIPTYNAQNTIKKAVDSAINQKFPKKDFEIIVVNDGSSDKTSEVLKKYNGRIRILNQKNQGSVKAANYGFKKAKGKYLIKLDADDYFEVNILKEMVPVLERGPNIDFVYCDYYEKPEKGTKKLVLTENIFDTVAIGIMFRKSKLAQEDFYREDIVFSEYDLLLKTQDKWKGYRIAKPLFYYNRRKGSLTSNSQLVEEGINELRKLYPQKEEEINKIREY